MRKKGMTEFIIRSYVVCSNFEGVLWDIHNRQGKQIIKNRLYMESYYNKHFQTMTLCNFGVSVLATPPLHSPQWLKVVLEEFEFYKKNRLTLFAISFFQDSLFSVICYIFLLSYSFVSGFTVVFFLPVLFTYRYSRAQENC